jgi:hypothetical protein
MAGPASKIRSACEFPDPQRNQPGKGIIRILQDTTGKAAASWITVTEVAKIDPRQ